jgi:hypothetical protein
MHFMGDIAMRSPSRVTACALLLILSAVLPASAATLTVGPGAQFQRIEDANAKAKDGDVIEVLPLADGKACEKTAVMVHRKGLTFRGKIGADGKRVKISGQGFDYSGAGPTPRAIFQINNNADGCTIEGFELEEAHNDSHNGAGVRVERANNATLRNLEIHNCDMGMMSNGDGTQDKMAGLLVERCVIHHNGNAKDPGQNHNLYMGGTSLTVRFCDIYSSLTGHNVKSRAHYTRVEFCHIHDSANREFDLVDGKGDTTAAESHAVLVGNIIVKAADCKGNKAVIHFGQDGKNEHDGTIFLINNTIVTPYISPVVDLSAAKAKAHFVNNIIYDGGHAAGGQVLVSLRNGADREGVTGEQNWFSSRFSPESITSAGNHMLGGLSAGPVALPFADAAKGDYRLVKDMGAGLPAAKIKVPAPPKVPGEPLKAAPEPPLLGWQYKRPRRMAKSDQTAKSRALGRMSLLESREDAAKTMSGPPISRFLLRLDATYI